jgi:protein-S-isoprenylcysteine O-methyltransferase Ste14
MVLIDPRWLFLRIPLGIGVLILSLWLARSGLSVVFGEVREKPHVIREGVFGFVRHPIYLGAILLYLGLLVFSLSLAAVAVWAIIIGFYIYLCRYEERLLTEKFGDEYLAYMKEVPMLLPRKTW